MTWNRWRLLTALSCLLFAGALWNSSAAAQTKIPLINDDVIRMARVKFDDPTIIKTIQTHDTNFDLSVDALLKLKQGGVSQGVIQVMLSTTTDKGRKSGERSVVTQTGTWTVSEQITGLPDEVGVFVRQKGKLLAIDPEIVNWRTGGVLKQHATLGLDKGHVNGTVAGPHSKLEFSTPPFGMAGSIEVYIRCVEGNSASEYQLLRFWEKGDRREFRAVTGGVLHASGGAKDNAVQFKFEKVAPRIYKIELSNLGAGEYGFLAPGAVVSTNLDSQGKMYTFRIVE